MLNKSFYFLTVLCLFSLGCLAQDKITKSETNYINSLVLPIFIALIGYILKSVYDILIERQKRKRNLVEEKLKNFYWPILTRLEQNNSIWNLILNKKANLNELEKAIGLYVEENIILKNHREIMAIIISNRFLAKFDNDLSQALKSYFKHVAIYEGILEAKANIFPGDMGAFYPNEFDDIIRKKDQSHFSSNWIKNLFYRNKYMLKSSAILLTIFFLKPAMTHEQTSYYNTYNNDNTNLL